MPPKPSKKGAAAKGKSKEKNDKKIQEEKAKECEEKCNEARSFLEPVGKNPEPNFVKAKAALDAAEELLPTNPTIFLLRGHAARMQGDDKEAVAHYSHALDLDPSSAITLEARAGSYERLQQIPLAIEDYTSMIQIEPENDHAYNMRGMCVARGRVPGLHLRSADFKRCVDDLKTAIRLNGANYYAHANLGKVYEDQEKFEEAIACYTDSLKINVDYTYAKFRRGCTYLCVSERLLLGDAASSGSDDDSEEAAAERKKKALAKATYNDVEREIKARVASETAKKKGHDFLLLAIADFESLVLREDQRLLTDVMVPLNLGICYIMQDELSKAEDNYKFTDEIIAARPSLVEDGKADPIENVETIQRVLTMRKAQLKEKKQQRAQAQM